ncbi:MAG: tetratricopeptide repeat protein [Clostridiales bacterium]|nr:tetratricopeptide repeat protein [Clostridiales bacterium]
MDERMIFTILGIEKTKDENAIRTAYRTLLMQTNPEDDPEGFKRLREAYERAMEYAEKPEEEAVEEPEDDTPAGQWMKQVKEVYFSLSRRLKEEEWKRLVHEDICMDLEYGEEVKWRLFSFLAEHFQLPSRIYQLLNETFRIEEEAEAFREHLPVEFVNFLIRRVHDTEGNMDFSYEEFEGADDADYDEFLRYYNELADQTMKEDGAAASQTVQAMAGLEIDHPLFRLEMARTELLCGKEGKALDLIRPLVAEHKDSLRIQVLGAELLYKCGQHDEAAELLKPYSEEGYYLVEKYLTLYEEEKGNLEQAIRHCLKALRDGEDETLEKLLEEMDNRFIEQNAGKAEGGLLADEDASCLIGCFSRRNRAQDGIDFLEKYPEYAARMERLHEFLCSLYFQVERFEDSIAESYLWRENLTEEKRLEREIRSHLFEGEGWFQLGKKGQEGAYQKAKDAYEAAAALDQEDLNLKQKVLDIMITLEQYEDAVRLADEIIEKNEGWFPAFVQKQKACFELHEAQQVIDNFYRAKNIYPGFPGIYEKAAEVFCIFGQYGDADNIFAQAKEAEVASPMLDVLNLRCMRLKEWKERQERRGQGDYSKFENEELTRLSEMLRAKYEKEPVETETMGKLYQELGLLSRDRRDFKHAIRYFRKAIKQDDRPYYHYLLANALFDDNIEEEALKEYHIYEKKAGPDEDLYVNMARCYRSAGKRKESITYFKKVLEVNQENDEANGSIAGLYRNILVDSGNKYYGELARPYSDRQLEITPNDGYYLRERGLLLLEMNLFEEALADFDASLEADPESPYGFNLKGKALYYLHRDEEAMDCFQKAIDFMDPDDRFTGPYLNSGDCLRRAGKIEDAAGWYRKGIQMFGGGASFYQRLYWMYRANGQFEKAKAVIEEQWKKGQIEKQEYESDLLLMDELIHTERSASYVKRGEKLAEEYDNIDAWEELSHLYLYEADDPQKALDAVLKAYKKAKKEERLWEERSVLLQVIQCYKLSGDTKKAETYAALFQQELRKAYSYNLEKDAVAQYLDDAQENVENIFDLAQCLLGRGEIEEAEKYLDQMHRKGLCRKCSKRVCSEVLQLQGMICEEKGELEAAIEHYKKALAVDPSLRYCIYRIKKLEKTSKTGNKKPKRKKGGLSFWRKVYGE